MKRPLIGALSKASAANCKVDLKYTFVKNCKSKEKDKLDKLVDKKITTALGALVVALGDKDPKVQSVACAVIYRKYTANYNIDKFKKNPALLTDGLVKTFLNNVAKMKEYRVFYAVQALTKVTTLKGGKYPGLLYKVVDAHPQKKELIRDVYPYILIYGRLNQFGKIKELAKSNDKKIRWAALYAPRNMVPRGAERKQVCPWLATFQNEPNEANLKNVVTVLSAWCGGGKYRDIALSVAEKRAKLDRWFVYDAAAFSCGTFKGKDVTEQDCKRRAALRKKVGIKP